MISYLKISRLDHSLKHIFIVPGIFIAVLYTSIDNLNYFNICIGFICSILSASSNYTINEYLDSKFDKFHPLKKKIDTILLGDKYLTQYVKRKYLT